MTQTRLLFIRIIGFPRQLNDAAADVLHPDSLPPNSSLCLRRRHPSSSFLLMIPLFHAAQCLSRASPFVSAVIQSVSLSHSPAERRATFLKFLSSYVRLQLALTLQSVGPRLCASSSDINTDAPASSYHCCMKLILLDQFLTVFFRAEAVSLGLTRFPILVYLHNWGFYFTKPRY